MKVAKRLKNVFCHLVPLRTTSGRTTKLQQGSPTSDWSMRGRWRRRAARSLRLPVVWNIHLDKFPVLDTRSSWFIFTQENYTHTHLIHLKILPFSHHSSFSLFCTFKKNIRIFFGVQLNKTYKITDWYDESMQCSAFWGGFYADFF